jgi:hypothetical protein
MSKRSGGKVAGGVGKSAREGDPAKYVLNVDDAHMIKRRNDGRINGCWVSPVVACARYYGFSDATPESVVERATVDGADIEESAPYILWHHFGVGTSACLKSGWTEGDDPHVWFHGCEEGWKIKDPSEDTNLGMFEDDYGTEKVGDKWFAALKECIDTDNLALLLGKRLEAGEAKSHAKAADTGQAGSSEFPPPPTHYLLVLGYQVEIGRRRSKTYTLYLKDSEEGNRVVRAKLEADNDGKIVLKTTQESGGALDSFCLLECYLICGKVSQRLSKCNT